MNGDSLHGLFDSRGVRIVLTSVLGMLAIFLLVLTISTLSGIGRSANPATDTITVQGTGEATLPPDVANISFTVENTATTVSDAQAATTKQANAVLDFVKERGIDEKDVKTLSYNISPQYSYPGPCPAGSFCPIQSPRVTGYQVSETVQVTVRDLEKVGDLIAGFGRLEVQNLSGPAFTLDDTTAGYDAARADAIAKAKAQAKLLSKQLGVSLGKIVNFSESSGGTPYPMLYGMGGDSAVKAATPNIPAGENTYTAFVSITYEIR